MWCICFFSCMRSVRSITYTLNMVSARTDTVQNIIVICGIFSDAIDS